ncbi:MAG: hypothetical protein ACRDPA_22560, partial [Solirubrobacteraceae bacterium]
MRRLILASIVLTGMVAAVPAAGAVRGRPCARVIVPSNPAFISSHIRTDSIGCAEARAIVRRYMRTWQRSARCRALADNSPYIGCRMQHGFRCELGAYPGRTSSAQDCIRTGRDGASVFFRWNRTPRASQAGRAPAVASRRARYEV